MLDLLVHLNASKGGRTVIAAIVMIPIIFAVVWLNYRSRRAARRRNNPGNIVICRPASGWWFLGLLLGVAMVAGGIALPLYGGGNQTASWLVGCCNVFLGCYLCLGVLRSSVVLQPDAIEVTGIFGSRRLRRGDVASKRYVPNLGHILYPKKRGRNIKVGLIYDEQKRIDEWVKDIPKSNGGDRMG